MSKINATMFTVGENIQRLDHNEIFVFGSNDQGYHGAGAARVAREKFNAKMGKGIGFCSKQSYGIPTVLWKKQRKRASLEYIAHYIDKFYLDAQKNPKLKFLVTQIGCGLSGYTKENIIPLFKNFFFESLDNVFFPIEWFEIVDKEYINKKE